MPHFGLVLPLWDKSSSLTSNIKYIYIFHIDWEWKLKAKLTKGMGDHYYGDAQMSDKVWYDSSIWYEFNIYFVSFD